MQKFILFSLVIILASCSKDNEAAKKLDGSWNLKKFSWMGKDSIPSGEFTSDTLGNWRFASCKSKTETCRGTAENFLGGGTEGFGWYIRNNGKKFTFLADEVQSKISQFSGDWDIAEISENSFIISSESCGSCKLFGKETLTFSK